MLRNSDDRPMLSESFYERSRSPLRIEYDRKLNSYDHDADIHIGHLRDDSKYSLASANHTPPRQLSLEVNSIRPGNLMSNRSLDSPIRAAADLLNQGPRWIPYVQHELQESEARRQLLVDKLEDARKTIQMQAQRLNHLERSSIDSNLEVEDLRHREKKCNRRMQELERNKYEKQSQQLDNIRTREEMYNRVECLEVELKSIQIAHNLLQSEDTRKQEAIDRMTHNLNLLEDQNTKLLAEKGSNGKDLTTLKESLDVSRERNNWLESQSQELKNTIERVRKEKQKLLKDSKEANLQLNRIHSSVSELKEENACLTSRMEVLSEEKQRFINQIEKQQSLIADCKATLASTASDKERLFQENVDMHQRLQNVIIESEKAQTVAEVMSTELASIKERLDKATETNRSLEQTNRTALKQHDLYEQEIKYLHSQLENMKQKFNNSVHNLEETSESQQNEIESWKSNCEKLAISLERKENEIQTLDKRVIILEEEAVHLKKKHETLHNEQEELMENKERVLRLQDENRRLQQERAENQQLIQLLETQNKTLADTSNTSLPEVPDVSHVQFQLDEVTIENNSLKDIIHNLEKTNEELIKQREEKLGKDTTDGASLAYKATIENLQEEIHQQRDANKMLADQVKSKEKDNICLKNQQEEHVNKSKLRRIEREKQKLSEDYNMLKSQHKVLEEQNRKMLFDNKANNGEANITNLQKEKETLETQVSLLEAEVSRLEYSKKDTDENAHKLQKKVDALQQELFESSNGQTERILTLQKQVNQLQAEQENSQMKLTAQQKLLKEPTIQESDEMENMQAEIDKLMTVIRVKHHELEDLQRQLDTSKHTILEKDEVIENLMNNSNATPDQVKREETHSSPGLVHGNSPDNSGGQRQNSELSVPVSQLVKERDKAVEEAANLSGRLEDLQKSLDQEKLNFQEQLHRELRTRDRQIECLEEQLKRVTQLEIKRLKRDAGRVQLMERENLILQEEIATNTKSKFDLTLLERRKDAEDDPPTNSSDECELLKNAQQNNETVKVHTADENPTFTKYSSMNVKNRNPFFVGQPSTKVNDDQASTISSYSNVSSQTSNKIKQLEEFNEETDNPTSSSVTRGNHFSPKLANHDIGKTNSVGSTTQNTDKSSAEKYRQSAIPVMSKANAEASKVPRRRCRSAKAVLFRTPECFDLEDGKEIPKRQSSRKLSRQAKIENKHASTMTLRQRSKSPTPSSTAWTNLSYSLEDLNFGKTRRSDSTDQHASPLKVITPSIKPLQRSQSAPPGGQRHRHGHVKEQESIVPKSLELEIRPNWRV